VFCKLFNGEHTVDKLKLNLKSANYQVNFPLAKNTAITCKEFSLLYKIFKPAKDT